jgi:hypothetical protein
LWQRYKAGGPASRCPDVVRGETNDVGQVEVGIGSGEQRAGAEHDLLATVGVLGAKTRATSPQWPERCVSTTTAANSPGCPAGVYTSDVVLGVRLVSWNTVP